jgi:outer membrane immunogenic protein
MKFRIMAALAVIAIALVPNSASAQSNEVILQRLDAVEKENAALRDRVRQLEAKNTALHAASAAPLSSAATSAMVAKAPIASAPDRRPLAPFNWTGVYVGAHSGYALGKWRAPGVTSDFPPTHFDGWFGGAQVGANYQLPNNWLVGAVADLSQADINLSQERIDGVDLNHIEQLGTFRGRVGYAFDRTLLYATGGLALGRMNIIDREFGPDAVAVNPHGLQASDTHTLLGYGVGGGVETALLDNFTFNIEYLWLDLTPQTFLFTFPPPKSSGAGAVGWQGQVLKFGVNYLFH